MTDAVIGRAVIDLEANSTSLEAGMARAQQAVGQFEKTAQTSVTNAGRSISAAGKLVADSGEAMGSTARRFLAALERESAQVGRTRAEYLEYRAAQLGVGSTAQQFIDKLKQSESNLKSTGVSAAQTAAAMRMLPAQFTDIATQLAGGQNPLLILMQQGGQIKDSFGGIGPAIAAIAGALNPTTIAVGAAAAAVAGLSLAAYNGSQTLAELNKVLLLSGNAAGVSAASFFVLSTKVAEAANTTVGAARDALDSVIKSGAFGPDLLQPVATATARLAELTDRSTDQVVADFVRMGDGVAKYAAETNKATHLLSLAQYEQIKALEEAGRAQEAQGIYLKALNDRLAEHDKTIGGVARAWKSAKEWASEYFSWLGGTFQSTSIDRLLELERAKLQRLEKANKSSEGSFFGAGRFDAQIAESRQTIAALESSQQLSAAVSKAQADRAKSEQEGIAAKDFLDKLNARIKGTNQLKQALAELARQQDAYRAVGGILSKDEAAAQVAQIKKDFAPSAQERAVAAAQLKYDVDVVKANYALLGSAISNGELLLEARRTAGLVSEREYFQSKREAIQLSTELQIEDLQEQKRRYEEDAANGKERINNLRHAALAEIEITKAREAATAKLTQIDIEQSAAQRERTKSIRAFLDAQRDQLAVQSRQNALELGVAGLGPLEAGRQRDRAAIEERYASQRRDLERQLDSTPVQQTEQRQALSDRISILRSGLDDELALYDKHFKDLRDLEANAYVGRSAALNAYLEENRNVMRQTNQLWTTSIHGLEDALTSFIATGKADFKSLVQTIIAEVVRMQVVKPMLSSIFGLFGSAGSAGTAGASDWYGEFLASIGIGTRAGGGRTLPGQTYLVGEKGPELLTMGPTPGFVTPNDVMRRMAASGDSGDITIHATYQIGQGVNRAEVIQAVAAGNAQLKADLARSRSRGQGIFA